MEKSKLRIVFHYNSTLRTLDILAKNTTDKDLEYFSDKPLLDSLVFLKIKNENNGVLTIGDATPDGWYSNNVFVSQLDDAEPLVFYVKSGEGVDKRYMLEDLINLNRIDFRDQTKMKVSFRVLLFSDVNRAKREEYESDWYPFELPNEQAHSWPVKLNSGSKSNSKNIPIVPRLGGSTSSK